MSLGQPHEIQKVLDLLGHTVEAAART
jgi:hypothetical protein